MEKYNGILENEAALDNFGVIAALLRLHGFHLEITMEDNTVKITAPGVWWFKLIPDGKGGFTIEDEMLCGRGKKKKAA